MAAVAPLPPYASQQVADSSLGPLFWGLEVQLLLGGIVINQCYNYVLTDQFKADGPRLKGLLLAAMMAFTATTCLSLVGIAGYGMSQRRDEEKFFTQTLDDCFATIFSGILGALVQGYLMHRASALFKSRIYRAIFIGVGAIIIVVGFLGALMYLVISFMQRAGTLEGRNGFFRFSVAIGMWTWASAAVDMMNTTALVMLLKAKILGFNARTDGVIKRWIELAFVTVLPTTVLAVTGAALSFAFPDGHPAANTPLAFWEVMPSLYASSLISTLAAREKIRVGSESTDAGVSRPNVSGYSAYSQGSHNISLRPGQSGTDVLSPTLSRQPTHLTRADSYSGETKEDSKV